MKRFHVHLHVDDLGKNIAFYSKLFGAAPTRAAAADMTLLDKGETTCCFARSDKHWLTDPQGMAWEHFHTLGDIPVFNEYDAGGEAAACCAPKTPAPASGPCCAPGKYC